MNMYVSHLSEICLSYTLVLQNIKGWTSTFIVIILFNKFYSHTVHTFIEDAFLL